MAGDRFEGTVLLRPILPVAPAVPKADGVTGVPGIDTLGLCRSREFLEDREPFRRMTAVLRTLDDPALALEADLPMAAFGVCMDGGPLPVTSSLDFSSIAVPVIPIKKLS